MKFLTLSVLVAALVPMSAFAGARCVKGPNTPYYAQCQLYTDAQRCQMFQCEWTVYSSCYAGPNTPYYMKDICHLYDNPQKCLSFQCEWQY